VQQIHFSEWERQGFSLVHCRTNPLPSTPISFSSDPISNRAFHQQRGSSFLLGQRSSSNILASAKYLPVPQRDAVESQAPPHTIPTKLLFSAELPDASMTISHVISARKLLQLLPKPKPPENLNHQSRYDQTIRRGDSPGSRHGGHAACIYPLRRVMEGKESSHFSSLAWLPWFAVFYLGR